MGWILSVTGLRGYGGQDGYSYAAAVLHRLMDVIDGSG